MGGITRIVLALGGLVPALSVSLAAQAAPAIAAGARVRLTLASEEQVAGTYRERVGDSLLLQVTGPVGIEGRYVPLGSLRRIEVWAGRRHPYGTSILWGAGIGTAAGALLGLVRPLCEPADFGEALACAVLLQPGTRGEAVAITTATGAFGGMLIGVIVGAVGHDDWRPATVAGWRPVVAASIGGVRLGLRKPVRF